MFVLTIDQRASTRRGDRVPGLLAALESALKDQQGVEFAFERTVGDEVQGVLSNAATALAALRTVMREADWSIGIGTGTVTTSGARTSREASGQAFVNARAAVERAKRKSTTAALAVESPNTAASESCEALLQLLGAVIAQRTDKGWEAVDAVQDKSQQEVADMLGISRQAVNQRLQLALWAEEVAVLPLAVSLLEGVDA